MTSSSAPPAARVRRARVEDVLPSELYLVRLEGDGGTGGTMRAHLSAEMRMHYVRLLPGARVEVEVSPFDPSRGRILSVV